MKLNKELLKQMIDEKLVVVQKHPTADLFIYNYSPTVQYDKLWNEITIQTRGLILDNDLNIVAKPFKKFFNLEELDINQIPLLPFEVFDKMDGSLGILYWLEDKPYIATRGSFTSEQAIHATDVLYKKYSHLFYKLDKNCTYLFEIIFPNNRIVLEYFDTDDIFLLTVINNITGEESLPDIGFPLVKKYDAIKDFNQLKALNLENKEGFVIKFSNNFRLKIKFEEYVRLHRILTGVSNIAIWEYLMEGKNFDELLDKVPDEFYNWVKNTVNELNNNFNSILEESKSVYKILDTRKDTALYFKEQKYPHVLFAMLDNKDVDKLIWKMIKPKFSKPFKNNLEN